MSPSDLQGLATRWLANLPGRDSHPLDYMTLPGRTSMVSPEFRAKLQEYAKLTNSSQCRVEGCAWTHGFRGLFRIRMIISADILRFALGADQLSGDLCLV